MPHFQLMLQVAGRVALKGFGSLEAFETAREAKTGGKTGKTMTEWHKKNMKNMAVLSWFVIGERQLPKGQSQPQLTQQHGGISGSVHLCTSSVFLWLLGMNLLWLGDVLPLSLCHKGWRVVKGRHLPTESVQSPTFIYFSVPTSISSFSALYQACAMNSSSHPKSGYKMLQNM